MYVDILIFAAIAAFLIYRLNAILGSRNGGERQRANPFAPQKIQTPRQPVEPPRTAGRPVVPAASFQQLIDDAANKDGRIETGLAEIAAADPNFELNGFMQGARYAFEMIVTAYNKGDIETLRPLLSPRLFSDFSAEISARTAAGKTVEFTLHRIKAARVHEAHLGGTMAYVTVDYDVEQTTVVRDSAGNVVEGNPDRIFSVEDIWTFTRDLRSADPNWTLIETRSVEK